MNNIQFPEPFKHFHPRVRDLNEIVDKQLTIGERCTNRVAAKAGSWRFIVVQTIVFLAWIVVRVLTLFDIEIPILYIDEPCIIRGGSVRRARNHDEPEPASSIRPA